MPNRAVKGELEFAQRFSSTFVLSILENLFDKYWKYVSTPRGPYSKVEYAEGHYFQKTLTTHVCPKTYLSTKQILFLFPCRHLRWKVSFLF